MICRLSILNNLPFIIPKTGLVEVQAYIRGCVKYCGLSQYLLWKCNAMYDYCCMNIAYLRRYYSLLLWITGCTDNVWLSTRERVVPPDHDSTRRLFSYNEIFINDYRIECDKEFPNIWRLKTVAHRRHHSSVLLYPTP